MTTIIGVQRSSGCEVWADNTTAASDYREWTTESMPKVIERAEYILAASGDGGICEYAMHAFPLPIPPSAPNYGHYGFMTGIFVPSLRRRLREEFDFRWDGADGGPQLQMLVGIGGRLYQLDSDGTVLTGRMFFGIGSGAAYALGALFVDPSDVRKALEAAASNDIYTGHIFTKLIQKGADVEQRVR